VTTLPRTDVPTAWDERTMLTTFLDYARATVHAKCAGVSPTDAVLAPLPGSPLMTIAGLVNHLRWVEYSWIEVDFLGGEDLTPWSKEDPDAEMRIAVDFPLDQLLTEYEEQCARYRALVDHFDLDQPAKAALGTGEFPTLRWILYHLLEETARHNGHLDVLRELADGVTGD
jgi:uncharacterized damage-inducible protein DinB